MTARALQGQATARPIPTCARRTKYLYNPCKQERFGTYSPPDAAHPPETNRCTKSTSLLRSAAKNVCLWLPNGDHAHPRCGNATPASAGQRLKMTLCVSATVTPASVGGSSELKDGRGHREARRRAPTGNGRARGQVDHPCTGRRRRPQPPRKLCVFASRGRVSGHGILGWKGGSRVHPPSSF